MLEPNKKEQDKSSYLFLEHHNNYSDAKLRRILTLAISCRAKFHARRRPRCVSRLSSPLPPEATRDRQTVSNDALDALVTTRLS